MIINIYTASLLQVGWLHIAINFVFPVPILKYLNLKNYSYFCWELHRLLVNEINGIINFDKFSHSYDNLYLGVTFWDTGYVDIFQTYWIILDTSILRSLVIQQSQPILKLQVPFCILLTVFGNPRNNSVIVFINILLNIKIYYTIFWITILNNTSFHTLMVPSHHHFVTILCVLKTV